MSKIITIGLDLDNTLIEYDEQFYNLALSERLIPKDTERNKTGVRNYLVKKGLEDEFTKLQSEIYGVKIMGVIPKDNLLKVLANLGRAGCKLVIISHKTKYPYKGPKYDLHNAAEKWLELNGLYKFGRKKNIIKKVYFEETKKLKIKRIMSLNCDVFVDDLTEILNILPKKILRVHYSKSTNSWLAGPTINDWLDFEKIINEVFKPYNK